VTTCRDLCPYGPGIRADAHSGSNKIRQLRAIRRGVNPLARIGSWAVLRPSYRAAYLARMVERRHGELKPRCPSGACRFESGSGHSTGYARRPKSLKVQAPGRVSVTAHYFAGESLTHPFRPPRPLPSRPSPAPRSPSRRLPSDAGRARRACLPSAPAPGGRPPPAPGPGIHPPFRPGGSPGPSLRLLSPVVLASVAGARSAGPRRRARTGAVRPVRPVRPGRPGDREAGSRGPVREGRRGPGRGGPRTAPGAPREGGPAGVAGMCPVSHDRLRGVTRRDPR
jgi:hypothetical protein